MLRRLILLGTLTLLCPILGSLDMKSLEFRDQELKEMLLVLGELNQVSIIPDETVSGKGSYFFAAMDFDQALDLFLESFGLYARKENGAVLVSRIKLVLDKTRTRLALRARDVQADILLRNLSRGLGKTILFDTLSNESLSLYFEDAGVLDVLGAILAKNPGHYLETQEGFYYLRRKDPQQPLYVQSPGRPWFSREGGLWKARVEKARFRDLASDFFAQAGKEYLYLLEKDPLVENLYLSGKTFEDMLGSLLLVCGGDYKIENGVYCLVEAGRKEATKKVQSTVLLTLEFLSAMEFQKLLPPTLGPGNLVKVDERSNRLVLTGNTEELRQIVAFVQQVDRQGSGNELRRYDLRYLRTDEFFPLLPPELSSHGPVALPGKMSFLLGLPDSKRTRIQEVMELADKAPQTEAIRLRYLKIEDLLSQLPPHMNEANISRTKDNSLFFFRGSKEQRDLFLAHLALIDKARPQIRYEILIIKRNKGSGLNLETQLDGKETTRTDQSTLVGSLGKLLNVNLDVIADFGYTFGLNLSAALSTDQAKVLADTILNGLSGEKLSFQNTETTRYADVILDPGTGKPGGILRELSSGLFLNLEGWISGDDMVTMKLEATLSETLGKSSSSTAPSSSEKKISSTIRTSSGKPICITGLKENRLSSTKERIPFWGDIPLLGQLFQKSSESNLESEFAIYLVPHVEKEAGRSPEDRLDYLVATLRKGARL